jgi:hypothetical protein
MVDCYLIGDHVTLKRKKKSFRLIHPKTIFFHLRDLSFRRFINRQQIVQKTPIQLASRSITPQQDGSRKGRNAFFFSPASLSYVLRIALLAQKILALQYDESDLGRVHAPSVGRSIRTKESSIFFFFLELKSLKMDLVK